MKPFLKNIFILVIFNLLLFPVGYFLFSVIKTNVPPSNLSIVALAFSITAIISLAIFYRGQMKEPDSQTLHTLVALVVKFLLELIFALLWFIVAKKTSFQSVLIFFVLYLALSLFFILVVVKTLKNKAL